MIMKMVPPRLIFLVTMILSSSTTTTTTTATKIEISSSSSTDTTINNSDTTTTPTTNTTTTNIETNKKLENFEKTTSSSSSLPSIKQKREAWEVPENEEEEDKEEEEAVNHFYSPLPYTYIRSEDLPESFSWGNIGGGKSLLTRTLNQHLPHYCGSCWAHAAASSLADRIKIARRGRGEEINLSVQFLLNCGQSIGSCHAGEYHLAYKFIHEMGYIPYETCQPYLACSSDSTEGFCPYIDTTCKPINICRTCTDEWKCYEVHRFPNATVAEYGSYRKPSVDVIKAEIYARGPVVAGVYGDELHDHLGGVYTNKLAPKTINHAISIVGWGKMDDGSDESYWIIRNSWGQYWGESLGYARILMGYNVLGIESEICWGVPGKYTVGNYPCTEDGRNCRS